MCAEGGLCATANLLYQIITLLREQQSITKLYLIALVFAVPVAMLLVNFSGLAGAVLANLVIMAILVVLLVYEYLSIRKRLADGCGNLYVLVNYTALYHTHQILKEMEKRK